MLTLQPTHLYTIKKKKILKKLKKKKNLYPSLHLYARPFFIVAQNILISVSLAKVKEIAIVKQLQYTHAYSLSNPKFT